MTKHTKLLTRIVLPILALASVFGFYGVRRAEATVNCTNLTYSDSATDATSYSTASITPSSNALILASISTRTGITADPTQPTLTGAGLTWVVVNSVVFDTTSSSRRRVTLFRAMGASPSTGALTFDEAGQTQTAAVWTVDQCTGTDTTGTNGSGAIVQSATNADPSELTNTSLTVTLGAFSDPSNITYGAFGWGDTTFGTVGSGFTRLGSDTGDAEASIMNATEWQAANDTTVDFTNLNVGVAFGGIAAEIKAAGAAAPTTNTFTIQNATLTIKNGSMTITGR